MDPPTEHMPDLEARPHSYRERKLAHSDWAAMSTILHLWPEGVGAKMASSAKFLWTEKRERVPFSPKPSTLPTESVLLQGPDEGDSQMESRGVRLDPKLKGP